MKNFKTESAYGKIEGHIWCRSSAIGVDDEVGVGLWSLIVFTPSTEAEKNHLY